MYFVTSNLRTLQSHLIASFCHSLRRICVRIIYHPLFQSQAGLIPWGPVLDLNISVPADWWYEGWNSKDWRFTNFTAEQDIKAKNFNRYISYMTGVTTQEAAYFLCEYFAPLLLFNLCQSHCYYFISNL